MFALTRPHRQALATLVVLVFTIAPTGYLALNVWRINQPGHVRDVEIEAGRRLGLVVALDGVRYPRPGETVLTGLTLRQEDGRSRAKLLEVARARVVRMKQEGRDLVVVAEGLRLRGEGPRGVMAQVATLLRRANGSPVDRVTISARELHLDLGGGLGFDLRNLAGQFQFPGDDRTPTFSASYLMPNARAATRCELSLTRGQGPGGSRTTLAFQTMDGPPLPARVLDPFFASERWLGSEAKVEGTLTLRQDGSDAWQGDFSGNLLDVDLDTLAGSRFPNGRLTGRAGVAIRSARWGERPGGQGVGWVEAGGTLTAGQGTISTTLLRSLADQMRFRLAPRLDLSRTDLAYHGLGLRFRLTESGEIRLEGALGDDFAPGTVLARGDRATPLAFAPSGTASVRGLWNTLFPATDDVLVPVGAETHMLNYLPLPPTSPIAVQPLKAN